MIMIGSYSVVRLTQNQNESMTYLYGHVGQKDYFVAAQFQPVRLCLNLMKRSGTEKIEQLKHLSLKLQEVRPKDFAMTKEKEKSNLSDKLYIPTTEIYLQQLSLILTLQINQSVNMIL